MLTTTNALARSGKAMNFAAADHQAEFTPPTHALVRPLSIEGLRGFPRLLRDVNETTQNQSELTSCLALASPVDQ